MKIIIPLDEVKIGKFLKDERVKKGMTQTQLGKKIGISFMAVSHYERGRRFPRIEGLDKWANALGLEFEIKFTN